MSSACCSFCEQLPATSARGWGGQASKCPVCKQELWTAQDGASYRFDVHAPAGRKRWPWVAGGAAFIVAAIGIGVALSRSQAPPTPVAVQTPPRDLPVASRQEPIEAIPEMPVVKAKPARGVNRARAKPIVVAKPAPPVLASVKPVPWTYPEDAPRDKKAPRTVPASWNWSYFETPEDLEAELRHVTQIDFDPQYMERSKLEIANAAKEIIKANAEKNDGPDAFIRKLMKDRTDLAGMPFLLGKACSLPSDQAKQLARGSLGIRGFLAETAATTRKPTTVYVSPSRDPGASHFWQALQRGNGKTWGNPDSVPALQQILTAEHRDFRLPLVDFTRRIEGPKASELLARLAIFDLDAEIRGLALTALRSRPTAEYRAVLFKGLRYPWAPVVRRAGQAVEVLEMKEAIPELVAMLDEPVPGSAFAVVDENGKSKVMVRELVRVNHHRNCLLCHAPADTSTQPQQRELRDGSIPVGPVPSPQDPLPPSRSTVYYAARNGVTLVRADITYLRQDFSLVQEVKDHGKWSPGQRFDFLVRTRELTSDELDQRARAPVANYRETISAALRGLTGKNVPAIAQSWRDALGIVPPRVESGAKR